MKYTDEEKKPKEDSKPIVKDSTIGGENYGLQGLANRIAAKRAGMPQVSSDTAKGYAHGGPVLPQDGPIMPPMDLGGAGFDISGNGTMPVPMQGAPASIPVPQQTPPPPPQAPMAPPQMAPAPKPAPAVPPMSETATAVNQAPDTDYSFFKNLSADDRAALQQRLIDQQNSTGSMVSRGIAGLGDAISNSYGGKNTTFQKDVMANNELQQKKQLEGFDTQRQQKLQDMQATVEMQKNDPNSPLSAAFRDTLYKLTGQKLPSGMSASLGVQVIGPAGEIVPPVPAVAVIVYPCAKLALIVWLALTELNW